MKLCVKAVLASVILVGSVSFGNAQAASNYQARILVHLAPPTTKATPCTLPQSHPACSGIVTEGTLYPPSAYFAYVLVTDGDGIAGVGGMQFGISYDGALHSGVDIYSWTSCGTLEMPGPGWPAPLTGNMIFWDTNTACQRYEPAGPGTGVVATGGYFYLAAYTPDRLAIIPRPYDGLAIVSDCRAIEYVIESAASGSSLSSLGVAGFDRQGCSPCGGNSWCSSCVVSGAPSVVEGTGGHVYIVDDGGMRLSPGAFSNGIGTLISANWKIFGNGTITSDSGDSITVAAGPLGGGSTFTIDCDATFTTGPMHCVKKVTIDTYVPTQSTTWSGIKSLHR